VALVAFVLNLRRVPHGHKLAICGIAVFALWQLLRFLATSHTGVWFLLGSPFGPFAYKAHIQKRLEAQAEANRRRALREQYREIGL